MRVSHGKRNQGLPLVSSEAADAVGTIIMR